MPHIDARSFDDFAVDRRGTEAVTDVAAERDDIDAHTATSSPAFRGQG